MSQVYVPNLKSVVYFLLVDFSEIVVLVVTGGKPCPCPFDLD